MTPVQKWLETVEKQVKALTTAMNNLTPNISTMAKLVEFLDKELTDEQKSAITSAISTSKENIWLEWRDTRV